ncbi:hypothetical protein BT63DRAFT_455509 [Microthyrium microscopicum]|uniref:Uncharacterized protein n=1 Tax=Microthyrium microscopicum TaxID=703497 RepID=A0A6A6UEK9_9PEZI|nr:hypothetical protein BT63DRAFT_455509 [Microthyrium microscopicum]
MVMAKEKLSTLVNSVQFLFTRSSQLPFRLYEHNNFHELADKVHHLPGLLAQFTTFLQIEQGQRNTVLSSKALFDLSDLVEQCHAAFDRAEALISNEQPSQDGSLESSLQQRWGWHDAKPREVPYLTGYVDALASTLAVMAQCVQAGQMILASSACATAQQVEMIKASSRIPIEGLVAKQQIALVKAMDLYQGFQQDRPLTPPSEANASPKSPSIVIIATDKLNVENLAPYQEQSLVSNISERQSYSQSIAKIKQVTSQHVDVLLARWTAVHGDQVQTAKLSYDSIFPEDLVRRNSQRATVEDDHEIDIDEIRSKNKRKSSRPSNGPPPVLEPVTVCPTPISSPIPIPLPLHRQKSAPARPIQWTSTLDSSVMSDMRLAPNNPDRWLSSSGSPVMSGAQPDPASLHFPNGIPPPPPRSSFSTSPNTLNAPPFAVTHSLNQARRTSFPASPPSSHLLGALPSLMQRTTLSFPGPPTAPQSVISTQSGPSIHSSISQRMMQQSFNTTAVPPSVISTHSSSEPDYEIPIHWRRRLRNNTWDYENGIMMHNNSTLPPGRALHESDTVTEIPKSLVESSALRESRMGEVRVIQRSVEDAQRTRFRKFYEIPRALEYADVLALVQRSEAIRREDDARRGSQQLVRTRPDDGRKRSMVPSWAPTTRDLDQVLEENGMAERGQGGRDRRRSSTASRPPPMGPQRRQSERVERSKRPSVSFQEDERPRELEREREQRREREDRERRRERDERDRQRERERERESEHERERQREKEQDRDRKDRRSSQSTTYKQDSSTRRKSSTRRNSSRHPDSSSEREYSPPRSSSTRRDSSKGRQDDHDQSRSGQERSRSVGARKGSTTTRSALQGAGIVTILSALAADAFL